MYVIELLIKFASINCTNEIVAMLDNKKLSNIWIESKICYIIAFLVNSRDKLSSRSASTQDNHLVQPYNLTDVKGSACLFDHLRNI